MIPVHFSGGYNQVATYWALSAVDGFGKRTFATPVLINVRWNERTDLMVQRGDELVPSRAIVFVQQDMVVGEYLAQGDQTAIADPISLPSAAYMILQWRKDISMMGDDSFRQATL